MQLNPKRKLATQRLSYNGNLEHKHLRAFDQAPKWARSYDIVRVLEKEFVVKYYITGFQGKYKLC